MDQLEPCCGSVVTALQIGSLSCKGMSVGARVNTFS